MKLLLFYTYEFLASFIPFLSVFLIFAHTRKKNGQKTELLHTLLLFLLAAYVICVYDVTGSGTLWDGLTYQFQIRTSYVNLIPFSTGIHTVGYILNIILFLPFGFLVPMIWKKMRASYRTVIAGFSFSLLIELSQLLNNRRTDIDDLIMNTLGALIGFLIYKIFKKLIPTKLHNKLNDSASPVFECPLYLLILFTGRFFFFYEIGFVKLFFRFAGN